MRLDLPNGFYLDEIKAADAPAYLEHFSDKDTVDRLLKTPYPYTPKDADFWINHCLEAARKHPTPSTFAFRRPDGFLIGGIGLVLGNGSAIHRAEIGYWLARDYRGQGLATAAVRAVTQHGFTQFDLRRIEAFPFAHNPASQRVLQKAGYQQEGLLKAYYSKNETLLDSYIYATVRSSS